MVVGVKTPDNIVCQREPDMSHVKKVDFVTCIALVINCTSQTERTSEKIGLIVSVAERFVVSYSKGITRNPVDEYSVLTGA
jgi:hypothetical protein